MGCLVLGFSLVVSFFNAIFLISAPAETYYFGMIWTMLTPPYILTCVINMFLMVPFFRRFPYSSAYEVASNTSLLGTYVHLRLRSSMTYSTSMG